VRRHLPWIVLIACIVLLCSAALLLSATAAHGSVANIYQDGQLLYSIDLSAVETPYTIDITDDTGTNTVSVETGRICITDADCPDQICVHQGWIDQPGQPIVCLPHHLIIEIVGDTSSDSIDGLSQ